MVASKDCNIGMHSHISEPISFKLCVMTENNDQTPHSDASLSDLDLDSRTYVPIIPQSSQRIHVGHHTHTFQPSLFLPAMPIETVALCHFVSLLYWYTVNIF